MLISHGWQTLRRSNTAPFAVRAATRGSETERQMYTNYSNGEVYGSRFFNWAVIVGAAALVIVSFNSLAPQGTQTAAAPAKTVVVSADKHHAG